MKEKIFKAICLFSTFAGLIMLLLLLVDISIDGVGRLGMKFLTSFPSRYPEEAGVLPALVGSILIGLLVLLISFPIGVATGIYLEKYARKNIFTQLIEINLVNLSGVPSVVFGLLGLTVFVRLFGFGRSIIAGALTLSLLVLPIIVVATREAIKSVPETISEAAYSLGATKWQTIYQQILPVALPGILTGTILAVSRAIGETAPLLVVGAVAYISFLPKSLFDEFTVLPIQIFSWILRPHKEFHKNAAAAIIILLILTLSLNALAIYLRQKYRKRL